MTDWTTTSTHDLIEDGSLEIGDGYRAKNSEFGDHGLPFLRIGNIASGRLDLANAPLFPEDEIARVGRKISQAGDCVIATKATIGRLAFIKTGMPQVVYSPQVSYWRVLDPKRIEPRYLSYWLQSREFTLQATATKGSTAMADYINLADQRRMTITLPTLDAQRSVAAILAAYDELIENNLRRIDILEEMAQAIYREWFVNFRFPGHSEESMVEGEFGWVPESWRALPVKETVLRLKSGRTYKADQVAPNGAVVVIDQSREEVLGYHNDDPAHKASLDNPIVVFGDHTCRMQLMIEAFSVGPNVVPFVAMLDDPIIYLFHAVRDLVTTREYKRHWTELMAKKIELAPPRISQMFVQQVEPMHQLGRALQRQNENLRTTRDLLLPKLISGEIDISDLDIDTSWLS